MVQLLSHRLQDPRPLTTGDVPSARRAAVCGGGPGDRIDAEADLRSVSHLGDAFRQILAVDENDVAAGLAHDRGRVLPPYDVDGPVPAVPGQLHQVQAHCRVGRILDDPIALPQRHELVAGLLAAVGAMHNWPFCAFAAG